MPCSSSSLFSQGSNPSNWTSSPFCFNWRGLRKLSPTFLSFRRLGISGLRTKNLSLLNLVLARAITLSYGSGIMNGRSY